MLPERSSNQLHSAGKTPNANAGTPDLAMVVDSGHGSRSYPYGDWYALIGEEVELRLDGVLVRKGTVDTVDPGSSMLWLTSNPGSFDRKLYLRNEGYEVWIAPRDLQPAHIARVSAGTITT